MKTLFLAIFALAASIATSARPFEARDNDLRPGGALACPESDWKESPTTKCVSVSLPDGCWTLQGVVPIKSLKPAEGGACGAYSTKDCKAGTEVVNPAIFGDEKMKYMGGWTTPGFDNPDGLHGEVLAFKCWDCEKKACWAQ